MKKKIHWRKYFILAIWRIKGLKTYKLYKEMLIEEFMPYSEITHLQNLRLQSLVQHCYNNVPYYKSIFVQANLSPYEIQTAEDLNKIPILKKDDIRQNYELLMAANYSKRKLRKINTSGSTGKPFTFYDDQKERNEYITAGLWRIYKRCGWCPGERIASIWGYNEKRGKKSLGNSIKNFLMGVTYLNAWKSNFEDFEQWYLILKRHNVKIIECYASTGSRFAKWMLDNGKKLPNIKGIYATSEVLFDWQKEILEKAFNCNVFNLYGCGEVLHIGCSCEQGNIHINSDMVIVEIGPPDSNNNTPVILTGLKNKAMPFLRYINGDSLKITHTKCSCGRETPIIALSIARLSDVFKFKNGKVFPSLYFILRLYKQGFDGVELFQFLQDKIDHIELRIQKNDRFDNGTLCLLYDVINEIESHIEYQAKLELVFVNGFNESLKHFYAKSKVN
jgi:phenylacetate-CoA ligase